MYANAYNVFLYSDTSLKEYLANFPAKKLHRKPHHRPRNRYRNTPPLAKKMVDHMAYSDAAMGTPKSNSSGVATPITTPAMIDANGSNTNKTSASGAVSSKVKIVFTIIKQEPMLFRVQFKLHTNLASANVIIYHT